MRTPNVVGSKRHDAVVACLVADAQPVQRLWPPATRLASWVGLAIAIAGVFVARRGLADLTVRLQEPLFASQVASFAAAAVWIAWLALRSAVPGREPRPDELVIAALLVGLPAVLILTQSAETIRDPRLFVREGLTCTGTSLGVAALPWAALLIAVRRGAPVAPRTAGALAGTASMLVAAAAMRGACSLGDQYWHFLSWHVLPIVLWAGASAWIAQRWIRRWRDRHDLQET